MARMTLTEARDKATQAQRALARMLAVADSQPVAPHAKSYSDLLRRREQGTRHELGTLQTALADLVAGLSGIGPARNGQIGGQRQGGHATSATALDLVAPKAGTQRQRLLDVFKINRARNDGNSGGWSDGLTDVQLHRRTGLPANSVRPRRVELVDAGWLQDSGRTRQHNGRDHTVWSLTDAARERLQNGEPTT